MPKFEPGHKKIQGSGRQPGSVNRMTKKLQDLLEEMGFDVAKEFISAVSEIQDPQKRAQEIAKLFPYLYPKLANIQIETKTPQQLEIEQLSDLELERRVKQMLLLGENKNEAEKVIEQKHEGSGTTE